MLRREMFSVINHRSLVCLSLIHICGLGSEAVASVGLTTQPKFLGLSLFFVMNVAIAAIVARRTGEKAKRRANETLAEAILLTILF